MTNRPEPGAWKYRAITAPIQPVPPDPTQPETDAQRVARENAAAWTALAHADIPRSRRMIVEVHQCVACHKMWAVTQGDEHARRLAETCCGPYVCSACGTPKDIKYGSWCGPCNLKKQEERYLAMPLDAESYSGPIFANEQYFYDLDDFLTWCAAQGSRDPYGWHPETADLMTLEEKPNLVEWIEGRNELDHGDQEYDWEFLKPVQEALTAALVEHNANRKALWYTSSGKRPVIADDWAEDYDVEDEEASPHD